MIPAIADARLQNQCISKPRYRQAADVVEWLGAVQAQEYEAAKWGLGLRMTGGADEAVERAFEQGRILRTHVMRPTWHFVTPTDIRWLQELTAPRVHRLLAVYNRRLELDARTLTRGTAIVERALRDKRYLTRAELGERVRRAGYALDGMRLAHLAMYAELECVICSGPRRGKQFTYALVADRAPKARRLSRDEALAELSRRFFRSHGPATIRDFVWWSGLTTPDAKRGLEVIRAARQEVDGCSYWTVGRASPLPTKVPLAHLLPIYDEYLVSYRDRLAVPHGPATIGSGTGVTVSFWHALVIAGQIAGTWRTTRNAQGISIAATMLRRLTARERRALADAAERFGRFAAVPTAMVRSEPP
jgi:hypothetical protein